MKKTLITCFLAVSALVAAFLLLNSNRTSNGADAEYVHYVNDHYKVFALDTPDTISFAGERMPLELIDIRERLDRELLVNTYWQSSTLLLHKRANRWFPVIEPILAANGVPDDFKYLALAESGLTQAVSPAGASGFWQFLKSTGKEYDLEIREGIDERYHVEKATRAACDYLIKAKQETGSWTMAAAVYNYGKGNVSKQMKRQDADDYYDLLLNEETARYVFRITALKEIISQPSKYGFHFRPKDLYTPYRTVEIVLDSSITDMAAYAQYHGVNYKVLKILNPWLRDDTFSNPKGKEYRIKLPANDFKELSRKGRKSTSGQ